MKLFVIFFKDINDQIQKDIKISIDFKIIFSTNFHDFLNVFSKTTSDKLTSHREHDHRIVLKKNQKLEHNSLREINFRKLNFVKKYLENHFKKEFIIANHAFCFSSILLIKKFSDELRSCVNYRRLNQMILKKYSIFFIRKTFAQLSHVKIFFKIDIRQIFYKIRINEIFENLTTFITKFDVYKWRVLFFDFIDDSSTWQHYINDVLWNFLNDFCTAYFDDILIYNKNHKKHSVYVRKVLKRFRVASFQTDINKCEFFVIEIKYLKLIISINDIKMNSTKIKVIVKWSTFINLKHVRSFIEFCNFYRRFIKSFFKIVKSLNAFVKKNILFAWNSICDIVFRKFKNRVLKISILCHFDRKKQCYLKTNSSDTVNEKVLSQKQKNDLLHSIVFFSKNISSIECNYEIYDKKLFAIIRCFEKWRFELKATDLSMKIFTDHKSLEYFMTTKKLIKRQIKWFEFLSQYNFVIMYQSDAQNVKTNALIKRSNDQSFEKIKNRLEHQIKTLLFTNRLELLSIDPESDEKENSKKLTFVEKVSRANKNDEICFKIRRRLKTSELWKTSKLSTTSIENDDLSNHMNCIIKNELLYKKENLWVSSLDHLRLDVIRQVHDQIAVEHFGY